MPLRICFIQLIGIVWLLFLNVFNLSLRKSHEMMKKKKTLDIIYKECFKVIMKIIKKRSNVDKNIHLYINTNIHFPNQLKIIKIK